MLHRRILLVLGMVAACKGSHGQTVDAGGISDAGSPDGAPDTPPDAGSACHVGLAPVPWIPAAHTPTNAAVGDVNRDGIPDVLIGTGGDATVHVWLGAGGGRFRAGASYAMHDGAAGAVGLALADLDHDGKLDLVVSSTDVIVQLGNGDGTFGAKRVFAAGCAAGAVTIGDVSGDGELDAVAACPAQLGVLLGHGDGTFGPAVTYATAPEPTRAVIADLSGDGKPDLVVGSLHMGEVGVLIGNGDGSFQPRVDHDLPQVATGIAVADLDGNGALDVVAVADNDEIFNASLLLGDKDGNLSQLDLAVPPFPVAVALADVNGDGQVDRVTTHDLINTPFRDGAVSVEFRTADNSFHSSSALVGASPTSSVLADLDGDGKLDLVVPNSLGDNVSVELGNGDGTFRDTPRGGPIAFYLLADLDGDGKLDAVGPRTSPGTQTQPTSIVVQLGAGDGSFHDPVDIALASPPRSAVAGDVNHDGKLDLIVLTSDTTVTESVLLGNGDGTFQARIDQPAASDVFEIATADLNGDGKSDLVESHSSDAPFLSVQLGDGDGHFHPGGDVALLGPSGQPGPFALVDLDGDGMIDLVTIAGDSVRVLLGNGDGTFRDKIDYPTGIAPSALAVADLSGDGKPDLVVTGTTQAAGNFVRVMLGVGDGTFTTKGDVAAAHADNIKVADVTGDGVPDVVTFGGDVHTLSLLVGHGDGTLEPALELGADATGGGMVIADVTGDGRPDILLSGGSLFAATCLP
jgi:hypothetical protein